MKTIATLLAAAFLLAGLSPARADVENDTWKERCPPFFLQRGYPGSAKLVMGCSPGIVQVE